MRKNKKKGFYIDVTNNLLEKKHIENMGSSVWLFMWLLDAMTIIDYEKGTGKVLGGKPIKYEEIKEEMGVSERTYRRWVKRLEKSEYIKVIRTPYGLSFIVNKAKKRFGRSANNGISQVPKRHIWGNTNGTSNIRHNSKTLTEDKEILSNPFKLRNYLQG